MRGRGQGASNPPSIHPSAAGFRWKVRLFFTSTTRTASDVRGSSDWRHMDALAWTYVEEFKIQTGGRRAGEGFINIQLLPLQSHNDGRRSRSSSSEHTPLLWGLRMFSCAEFEFQKAVYLFSFLFFTLNCYVNLRWRYSLWCGNLIYLYFIIHFYLSESPVILQDCRDHSRGTGTLR